MIGRRERWHARCNPVARARRRRSARPRPVSRPNPPLPARLGRSTRTRHIMEG